jgi:hypothetical protein
MLSETAPTPLANLQMGNTRFLPYRHGMESKIHRKIVVWTIF